MPRGISCLLFITNPLFNLSLFIFILDDNYDLISEFIEVGKEARALDTLQEVFRNKKYSYTWSESIMEPIMMKYLELCVELKKSHIAKEGLFQYRNMFQLVIIVMECCIKCSGAYFSTFLFFKG